MNADQLSTADHAEIQRAQAAQHTAESALEEVHAQLQEEHENAGRLYKALRVEWQKVSRTKAAKAHAEANAAEAQSSLTQLEDQFEQLTLKNEQLEMTMSKMLEKWGKEKKIANETLQELRRRVRALQEKCWRAPDILQKALERTKIEGQKFALMEKGVYTDEAQELCRVLVNAGCSQDLVGDIIDEILAVAGISITGPTMACRTVG